MREEKPNPKRKEKNKKGDDSVCKEYLVCMCFDRKHCEEQTEEIAKRNNASNWFVEGVVAPCTSQIAYKGIIVKEEV